jgi:hypothetical protein
MAEQDGRVLKVLSISGKSEMWYRDSPQWCLLCIYLGTLSPPAKNRSIPWVLTLLNFHDTLLPTLPTHTHTHARARAHCTFESNSLAICLPTGFQDTSSDCCFSYATQIPCKRFIYYFPTSGGCIKPGIM